jgi:hypothetical protein
MLCSGTIPNTTSFLNSSGPACTFSLSLTYQSCILCLLIPASPSSTTTIVNSNGQQVTSDAAGSVLQLMTHLGYGQEQSCGYSLSSVPQLPYIDNFLIKLKLSINFEYFSSRDLCIYNNVYLIPLGEVGRLLL